MAIAQLSGASSNAAKAQQKKSIDRNQAEKQFNLFEKQGYAVNDGKVSSALEYSVLTNYYDENVKSFTKEAKNYIKKLFSAFIDNDTKKSGSANLYTVADIYRRFGTISKKNINEVEQYVAKHNMDGMEEARMQEIIYGIKYKGANDSGELAWAMDAISYQKQ